MSLLLKKPKGLLFVGIDPGKHGGIGFLWPHKQESFYTPIQVERKVHKFKKTKAGNRKVSVTTTYDIWGMLSLLEKVHEAIDDGYRVHLAIEAQQPRPDDSKGNVFTTGYGFGCWETVLAVMCIEPVYVWPHAWKPRYLPKGASKHDSLVLARKLFPRHMLPLEKDECRAEALLVAHYLRTKKLGHDFLRTPTRKGAKITKKQREQKELEAQTRSNVPKRKSSALLINVNRK